MFKAGLVSTVLTCAFAVPALAAPIHEPFSSFWVLGDSLSDNGTTAPVGSISTNDTVWNDGIIDEFAEAGKTAENLAFGSATATGGTAIDLGAQLVDFATSSIDARGDRPLVSLWFGGNDLLGGFTPENALGAAFAIDSAIDQLITLGVQDFVIFTLPDLGLIPLTAPFPEETRAQISGLATLFNATLASLFPPTVNISYIDVFSLTAEVIDPDNPYGFTSTMICRGSATVDCADTPFWDPIHPTSAAHDIIETQVREALTPVPLPAGAWLLLSGVLAFAGLKHRRKALA